MDDASGHCVPNKSKSSLDLPTDAQDDTELSSKDTSSFYHRAMLENVASPVGASSLESTPSSGNARLPEDGRTETPSVAFPTFRFPFC
jgi:hypothetical protein